MNKTRLAVITGSAVLIIVIIVIIAVSSALPRVKSLALLTSHPLEVADFAAYNRDHIDVALIHIPAATESGLTDPELISHREAIPNDAVGYTFVPNGSNAAYYILPAFADGQDVIYLWFAANEPLKLNVKAGIETTISWQSGPALAEPQLYKIVIKNGNSI